MILEATTIGMLLGNPYGSTYIPPTTWRSSHITSGNFPIP